MIKCCPGGMGDDGQGYELEKPDSYASWCIDYDPKSTGRQPVVMAVSWPLAAQSGPVKIDLVI